MERDPVTCTQPNPFTGKPCGQPVAYKAVVQFHGVSGDREVDVCADHLAYWREAFPDAVLAARTIKAEGGQSPALSAHQEPSESTDSHPNGENP